MRLDKEQSPSTCFCILNYYFFVIFLCGKEMIFLNLQNLHISFPHLDYPN